MLGQASFVALTWINSSFNRASIFSRRSLSPRACFGFLTRTYFCALRRYQRQSFYLQVISDGPVTAGSGKRFFCSWFAASQLFADNVVAAGSLQHLDVILGLYIYFDKGKICTFFIRAYLKVFFKDQECGRLAINQRIGTEPIIANPAEDFYCLLFIFYPKISVF